MKLSRHRNFFAAVLLLAIPGSSFSLPWDKDMVDQPTVKAQETLVAKAESTVPVGGKEGYPPPRDVIELVRARLDAGRTLQNPIPRTPESVERGAEIYATHCLLCHGADGRGDGPVGRKFVPQPMELNFDYVQVQPDGQLFYTISHGSIAMPYYRQAIEVDDRWHLVNYIKEAFGES